MRARCGLEDCDCEYTIERLVEALEKLDCENYYRPASCRETERDHKNWCLVCITRFEEERRRPA